MGERAQEVGHVRIWLSWAAGHSFLFCDRIRLYQGMRRAEERPLVSESTILLLISAALLVYLIYAMLRPEKF